MPAFTTLRAVSKSPASTSNAMHNVSFWDTFADANQMATFAPMIALGAEFAALGVSFDRPILNCNTLWQWDGK